MLVKSVTVKRKCFSCGNTTITWAPFTATLILVEHEYVKYGPTLCSQCHRSKMEPIFLECKLATEAKAKVKNSFWSV